MCGDDDEEEDEEEEEDEDIEEDEGDGGGGIFEMLSTSGQDAAEAAQDVALDEMEAAAERALVRLRQGKVASIAAKAAQQAEGDFEVMVNNLKAELRAKRSRASAAYQAKFDSLVKGLESQALYAKKIATKNPQAAEAFLSIYTAVAAVGQAHAIDLKGELLEAEKEMRAKAGKAVLNKFVGAELKVPTVYEAKSFLRMIQLVCMTNPHNIKRDRIETERLMNKLDELCAHVSTKL